jgi:hypothetical protein
MNTEISTSGDQKDWFSQDLAQNADQHIYNFVQFHRQMSPPTTAKSMKSHLGHWAPLIHQNKVTAVFESDSHLVCVFHPIRPSNESGSEDGFIRDDDTGTVYAGAGTWGAPLREANDQKNWTRDAGSFNQFKWVFVNKSKVEIRTVQYENLSNIAPRTDSNRFEIPANLNLWEPSNGGVVTIYPENAIKAYWLSPANNSHFNSGENINLKINIDMTNANGTTVNNVKFYLNQNLLGAAQSIGNNNYQYSWDTIGFEGVAKIYAEFTLSDGSKIKTNENNYNIGIITKIFEVTNENDDGEEYNGSMNLSSSDLEMVYDGSKKQKIGIRFDSLDIPKNSNIKEVYLIFNAKYSDNQTVNLEVEIEQSSSASNFSNKNLTERNYFEETVSWTPDQWTKDNNYQSSNLKELLQLVVNQNDWAASNAIVFKIEGDDNARRAYSCNYDECSKGPKLKVIYAP